MRNFISAAILVICSTAASAADIATYNIRAEDGAVISVLLSDVTYKHAECADIQGAKALEISSTQAGRQKLIEATGCWKEISGNIHILAYDLNNDEWFPMTIPVADFSRTSAFKSWQYELAEGDHLAPDNSVQFAYLDNSSVLISLGSQETNCFGRSGRTATASDKLSGEKMTGCWSLMGDDVVFISSDKRMKAYPKSHFIETRFFTGWSNP